MKRFTILEPLEAALWTQLRWLAMDAASAVLYEATTERTLRLLALVAEVHFRQGLTRRGSRATYRK